VVLFFVRATGIDQAHWNRKPLGFGRYSRIGSHDGGIERGGRFAFTARTIAGDDFVFQVADGDPTCAKQKDESRERDELIEIKQRVGTA